MEDYRHLKPIQNSDAGHLEFTPEIGFPGMIFSQIKMVGIRSF